MVGTAMILYPPYFSVNNWFFMLFSLNLHETEVENCSSAGAFCAPWAYFWRKDEHATDEVK